MIRGLCPNARSIRLTKWALRQASIPTTEGGSFSNASFRANRLIFQRKAILPSTLTPTTWKTSLPISTPTDANAAALGSILDFMAASPVGGASSERLAHRMEQPVHPISGYSYFESQPDECRQYG